MFSSNIVKVEACMAAMKSDKVKEALREVATLLFVLSLWTFLLIKTMAGDRGGGGQGGVRRSNHVLH